MEVESASSVDTPRFRYSEESLVEGKDTGSAELLRYILDDTPAACVKVEVNEESEESAETAEPM